jgi:hypothetical protein
LSFWHNVEQKTHFQTTTTTTAREPNQFIPFFWMKRDRLYFDRMAEDPENTERRQPSNQASPPGKWLLFFWIFSESIS